MGKNDVHWAAAEVLLALSCPSPAPRLMPWSSPDQRAPPPCWDSRIFLVPCSLHLDGFCLAHHCPVRPLETRWPTPLWMIRASFDLQWAACAWPWPTLGIIMDFLISPFFFVCTAARDLRRPPLSLMRWVLPPCL